MSKVTSDLLASLAIHHTAVTTQITLHQNQLQAALANHDSIMHGLLASHDSTMKAALGTHDTDIKAKFHLMALDFAEIEILLRTPPGERPGFNTQ